MFSVARFDPTAQSSSKSSPAGGVAGPKTKKKQRRDKKGGRQPQKREHDEEHHTKTQRKRGTDDNVGKESKIVQQVEDSKTGDIRYQPPSKKRKRKVDKRIEVGTVQREIENEDKPKENDGWESSWMLREEEKSQHRSNVNSDEVIVSTEMKKGDYAKEGTRNHDKKNHTDGQRLEQHHQNQSVVIVEDKRTGMVRKIATQKDLPKNAYSSRKKQQAHSRAVATKKDSDGDEKSLSSTNTSSSSSVPSSSSDSSSDSEVISSESSGSEDENDVHVDEEEDDVVLIKEPPLSSRGENKHNKYDSDRKFDRSLSEAVVSNAAEDKNDAKRTIQVIAPEQTSATMESLRRKRMGLSSSRKGGSFVTTRDRNQDEGIDDFEQASAENKNNTQGNKELDFALELSQKPLMEVATKLWNLPQFLIDNLRNEDAFQHFFPVQCLVIPDLIHSEQLSSVQQPRDICVAAPTGSGKTLSFVLPILHSIYSSAGGSSLQRRARRKVLRALVVLPSRDLAAQVHGVFETYAQGSSIKIGLAIGGGGQHSNFSEEQKSLMLRSSCSDGDPRDGDHDIMKLSDVLSGRSFVFEPNNIMTSLGFAGRNEFGHSQSDSISVHNKNIIHHSAVDILVCTPGRLKDHIEKTPGFSIQHIKYLVLDEADRLLNQSYHGWLTRVLRETSENNNSTVRPEQQSQQQRATEANGIKSKERDDVHYDEDSWITDLLNPITYRRPPVSLSLGTNATSNGTGRPVPLRKLLFSATMTHDPQKLSQLQLFHPKFINVHSLLLRKKLNTHSNQIGMEESLRKKRFIDAENSDNSKAEEKEEDANTDENGPTQQQQPQTQTYSLPSGLTEYTVECSLEQKALVLLALILEELQQENADQDRVNHNRGGGLVAVFTSSVESTHRLTRLLQLLWKSCKFGSSTHEIVEFSSNVKSQKLRSTILKRCSSAGTIKVLVCSDGMARGMDISNIKTIINYDIPSFAKTYVHRCGRTARAGRTGNAITILVVNNDNKDDDVRTFNKFRKLIQGYDFVKRNRGIQKHLLTNETLSNYSWCSEKLGRVLEMEQEGKLQPLIALGSSWFDDLKEKSSATSTNGSDSDSSQSVDKNDKDSDSTSSSGSTSDDDSIDDISYEQDLNDDDSSRSAE